MFKIIRRLEFDAGHRVMNHESKCANLHGHRYAIEVEAESEVLDSIGRVIDFSVLKQKIGTWLDDNWDHTTIVCNQDTQTIQALDACPRNKPLAVVPFNPTAENMAHYLLHEICPGLMEGTQVRITAITVHETPNCYARVQLE